MYPTTVSEMSTLCQVLKMQLYAFNANRQKIFASIATPSKDYFCQECGARVRTRKSRRGRAHFFHLFRSPTCRASKKSQEHIAVQNYIQKAIGEDACKQEVYFPKIGRVADLVWEEKAVCFEIQCSPITKQEVEKRCQDYSTIGYFVIWILMDKTFNGPLMSPAERFLETRTHYFVTVEGDMVHLLYDQYARKREPLAIDIATLTRRENKNLELRKRNLWEYYAFQDVIWHIEQKTAKGLMYHKFLQSGKRGYHFWIERFEYVWKLRFLRCIWNLIIENACR